MKSKKETQQTYDIPESVPTKFFLVFSFVASLLSAFVAVASTKIIERPHNEVRNFYEGEMASVISPATLKKMIDENDNSYILVDLRSAAEFGKEHFVTAINIPAVSMNEKQLIAAFSKLPKNKEIIVHCYSAYCTLGREVGLSLARHNIFVKELTIGWSELRYHWDLWNPGAKIDDGISYIATGSADKNAPVFPCTAGEFGC